MLNDKLVNLKNQIAQKNFETIAKSLKIGKCFHYAMGS